MVQLNTTRTMTYYKQEQKKKKKKKKHQKEDKNTKKQHKHTRPNVNKNSPFLPKFSFSIKNPGEMQNEKKNVTTTAKTLFGEMQKN